MKISFDENTGEMLYKFLGKADNSIFNSIYSLDSSERSLIRYQLVPCGNCIGCRLDYAETWADRLLVESFDKSALFITLTYNDDNLPLNGQGLSSISKEDIDIFIRDLRNKFRDVKVRYAISTEYGDNTLRAHAHCICYNLDFDNLGCHFYKLNHLGEPMYSSDVLEDVWNHKGYVVVEKANYYNMAYTARYILKKQKGQLASEYDAFELTPPSFRMSRRPGIGSEWFDRNYEELYTQGFVRVSRSVKANGMITPNRYFNKLLEKTDPQLLSKYKADSSDRNYELFHEKMRLSSFTLDRVTEYNDFARENFLKKNSFQRCNFV